MQNDKLLVKMQIMTLYSYRFSTDVFLILLLLFSCSRLLFSLFFLFSIAFAIALMYAVDNWQKCRYYWIQPKHTYNNSLNDVRKFLQVNPNEVKKKITYLNLMKCNIKYSLGKTEKIPHNIINIRHSNK